MSATTTLTTFVRREIVSYGETAIVSVGPPIPTGEYDDIPSDEAHKINTSGAIAIVSSSVSLFLALFAIYWFIRMRRRFRHNLIMLLIASNLWRSLWRLLFPLVEYIKDGIFSTESAFCQVSGFFTSQGIEAVDCAILLIAIHSALSVFKRNPGHGQGGLYPYRWWAYAFWVLFPILIAALAYTNPNHRGGYTSQGSICYLPSRPYTFLNLSWAPRYVVAAVVLAVYPSIYIYATHKLHQYSREMMEISRMQTYEKPPWYSRILPWFGLGKTVSQSQQKGSLMNTHEMRILGRRLHLKAYRSDKSNPSSIPYGSRPLPLDSSLVLDTRGVDVSAQHPRLPGGSWGFPAHELQQLSPQRTMQNDTQPQDPNLSDTGQDLSKPKPTKTRSDDAHDLSTEDTRTTSTTTMTDASTSAAVDFAQGLAGTAQELEAPQTIASRDRRLDSAVDLPMYKKTRRPESVPSRQSSSARSFVVSQTGTTSATQSPSVASSMLSRMSQTDTQNDVPRMAATNEMRVQHERMRRQLRYLFLYPAAYVLLYIPLFVGHILRASKSYYSNPSFVLSAFVIISASIQAGVDCVLFSWIEKPWGHIPGSDGSFLGSFACLSIHKRRRQGQVQDPADIRERLRQQIKDLERFDQRTLESDLVGRPIERSRRHGSRPSDPTRYWWEQFEDDENEISARKRNSIGNRRISFADGVGVFADEEDRRGRERRRRVSFSDGYGRELERKISLSGDEFYPSDARSRSVGPSSIRRRLSVQDDAYRFTGRNDSSEIRRHSPKFEDLDGEDGAERFDDISLNDDGQGIQDDEEDEDDEELPREPKIVETDDHG